MLLEKLIAFLESPALFSFTVWNYQTSLNFPRAGDVRAHSSSAGGQESGFEPFRFLYHFASTLHTDVHFLISCMFCFFEE